MNWFAKWAKRRADLQAIHGWENELVSVPAGPVREMIEDGEAMWRQIVELERQIAALRKSHSATTKDGEG